MNKKLAFWQHFPVDDQNVESLVHATRAFHEKYDLDIIKITPAGSWLATCYGVTDAWENDILGRRTIKNQCISNEDDWLSLPAINDESNLIDIYLEVARQLKHMNTDKPIYTTVFCPLSQAVQMAGIDRLKRHMASAPEKVAAGIAKITENTIAVLKRFAATGIAGNYFVTQAMQYSMFSPQEYEQWGKPYDTAWLKVSLQLFDETIFHIHGDHVFFSIDPAVEDARVHFEFNQASAEECKKIANQLLPGIPASVLAGITSETEALTLLNAMQQSTGQSVHMFTAGCVLPLDFPEAQVHFWKNLIQQDILQVS